jgi:hypothetical protein
VKVKGMDMTDIYMVEDMDMNMMGIHMVEDGWYEYGEEVFIKGVTGVGWYGYGGG